MPPPPPPPPPAQREAGPGEHPVLTEAEPGESVPAASADGGEHHAGHEHAGHHGGGKLRTALAALIAIISIVGALVTWRAEVAGSEAGKADLEGTVVAVNAEGERAKSETLARAEGRNAVRAYEAVKSRENLTNAATAAESTDVADELNRQAVQQDAAALKLLDGYFVIDFTKHDAAGYVQEPTYDVDKRVEDLLLQGRSEDTSGELFAEAAKADRHRINLYTIDVLLVMSLAMVSIGQVARRRRRTLFWALPGVALFVASTLSFVFVEV